MKNIQNNINNRSIFCRFNRQICQNDLLVGEDRWIRPPKNGTYCPVTGLSHGAFYNMLKKAKGQIKQVSLAYGRKRGARLVSFNSLNQYLNGLSEEKSQTFNNVPVEAATYEKSYEQNNKTGVAFLSFDPDGLVLLQ